MGWIETIRLALQSLIYLREDIKAIASFFRKAEENQWFNNLNEAFRPLNKPTTTEQKDEAAKKIADSISSL